MTVMILSPERLRLFTQTHMSPKKSQGANVVPGSMPVPPKPSLAGCMLSGHVDCFDAVIKRRRTPCGNCHLKESASRWSLHAGTRLAEALSLESEKRVPNGPLVSSPIQSR